MDVIAYRKNKDTNTWHRYGFAAAGMEPEVTATQFGGFNGNYIWSRPDSGKRMIIIGTGASELIHTNDETVSVKGIGAGHQRPFGCYAGVVSLHTHAMSPSGDIMGAPW